MTNPFSTRFTRPTVAEYLFEGDGNAAQIVAALENNDWRGCIVGPHGSGKSTLLHNLVPIFESAGVTPHIVSLNEGARTCDLPQENADSSKTNDCSINAVLIIDGYEQLSWFGRRRVAKYVATHNWGLLVTSHQPCGLPVVYETKPNLATTRQIVARLQSQHSVAITPDELAASFHRQHGNVREVLFELYDLAEQRRT